MIINNNKVLIYNNTSFLNEIANFILKLIPNSLLTTNYINDDYYYIIVSAINYYEPLPKLYDVIQLEQLEHPAFKIENNSYYLKLLENAQNIYDFSQYNIHKILQLYENIANKNNLKYLPLLPFAGYLYLNNINKKIINNLNKKYDVIFIGIINKRRKLICDKIKSEINKPIKFNSFNNLNINEKNNYLQNSNIVINIHYYDKAVLELERLNNCLNNNCFILSERSADKELDDLYKDYVIFCDNIEDLIEKIHYYSINIEERKDFANIAYKLFHQKNHIIEYPNINLLETQVANVLEKQVANVLETQVANVLGTKGLPEIEPYPVLNADYEINNKEKTLKLCKYPEFNDLPYVSLITITKNREIFYPFMLNNFNNFKYPFNKIEWIIVDDSDTNTTFFDKYKKINYIYKEPGFFDSIATKRNFAVSNAKYDIIIHIDDDDYYFPQSLYSKVKLLLKQSKENNLIQCIGTSNIGIYNMVDNNSYLNENNGVAEASLCYYKSFWVEKPFYSHFNGEGFSFLKNRYKNVCLLSYEFNLIVLNHNTNYTGKNRLISNSDINTNEIYKLFDFKTQSLLIDIRKKLGLIKTTDEIIS